MGQAVYVNASGGSTYSWSNGATGSNITLHPSTTTVYSVYITNANCCTGTGTIRLIVDTTCTATGVLSIYSEAGQSAVSPNPFTESATLNITGLAVAGTHEMKIFDVLGNEVRSIRFTGTELVIGRKDLDAGIYLYRIISEGGMFTTGKFVVGKL